MAAKESFEPDEPLPAFTFPAIDEATKEELLRSVEEAKAKAQSSVERVAAKESFAADEPLPAFTYPVLDEEKKQELIQRVEAARAATVQVAPPPAHVAPPAGAEPPVAVPPPAVPPPAVRTKLTAPARRFQFAELLSELRRIYGTAWRYGSAFAKRWFETACAFIDRNRSKLPVRLRKPLSKVGSGTILAVIAGVVFVFIALLLSLGGSKPVERHDAVLASGAPAAPPPPEEDTVDREIEGAKQQGIAALEKLAETLPRDYRVWIALAEENSTKGIHASAIAAVGKAIAADPKAADTEQARAVLSSAVRKRDTTDAAFETLQGPMGAAGAAVLYDLSIDPEAKISLRTRAEEWVRSDAFKRVAAPDVELAARLRYAKSCTERHDLLPRAGESGGKRVLDYLNIAKTPGGCGRRGRDDCFPCLRKDGALKDAISAIETRLGNH